MTQFSRRQFVTAGVLSTVTVASGAFAKTLPEPQRGPGVGGNERGPRDVGVERQNPDLLNPPATDNGSLPNLWFPFGQAHVRQETGGWTRQVTERSLPAATTIAGVEMRLNTGGIRELHWHKEGEWAFMTYGKARVTVIDAQGRYFVNDVSEGDLWYFPSGLPHSIQGLGPDGCQFLLAFDDGGFDENSTFLLGDWFKHTPPEILAKNFGIDASQFKDLPDPSELYIFAAKPPGPLSGDAIAHAKKTPVSYTHRMQAQSPDFSSDAGSVRIADTSNFPVSKTVAAALVEVKPGGLRELHWHPNNDEWQYYLEGQGRMGIFGGEGRARTFDVHAGDVGYVPFAMGHYIENTGDKPLRFLELFKSDHYADISLRQWLALTPPELVKQHLHLSDTFMQSLSTQETPVVAGVHKAKDPSST